MLLMMKKLFSCLAFFTVALAGAGEPNAPFKVAYICDKGTRVQAIYLNNSQGSFATVIVNGVKLKMQTQVSASGARYVGSGYTWWNKGNAGTLFKGTNLDTIVPLDSCLEKS
jgi:membrane-bound inhibitor of C-type lysozyme